MEQSQFTQRCKQSLLVTPTFPLKRALAWLINDKVTLMISCLRSERGKGPSVLNMVSDGSKWASKEVMSSLVKT